METIGIDFEFNNSNEQQMNIIACVMHSSKYGISKFNLLDEFDRNDFISTMYNISKREDIILLSYAVIAEARSLLSLGIDPLMYKWVDLYVEFIMLCNSNNRWKYGNYIPKTGGSGYSTPSDPSLSEEEQEKDTEDHTETPKNLVNAVFKLLGVRLDAKEKDEMRDLILSKNNKLIQESIEEILNYCESDTKYLRALDIAIIRELEKEGLGNFRDDQLQRGRYAVATAYCEQQGIPINMELLNKIIKKTPEILQMHKEAVNVHFNFFIPEYQRPPITRKNGSIFTYKPIPAHKDMASYQRYVESLKIPNFPRTKTGKYKLDKDTLEEFGYWGGLEELWKYNKTESSLKWFNPKGIYVDDMHFSGKYARLEGLGGNVKNKGNGDGFFERVGTDNNVRPYFGIFCTQTGRNAAKAKTFPLAMSSWLRAIVHPDKDHFIVGADFSQQEVYVAAILSKDENLLKAYLSGDVYLAFAKQAGLAPSDANKQSHKLVRNLCKSTVLGLQFGMGHAKLKIKLRLDSGQEVSDEKTAELIQAHKTVYSKYWEWVYEVTNEYKAGTPLVTNDGWVLFCDNPSIPSVRNFLVQGNAASITRLAITRMVEGGLKVMCGLHDAVYVITNNPSHTEHLMEQFMLEATKDILKEKHTNIRLDFKIISHDDIWIEEKGQKDWDKLKGFLL